MLRNGLSYREASDNANRIAEKAYNACIAAGAMEETAKYEANKAYEAEMKWYERK